MELDYSTAAFLQFLEFAGEKGLVKYETARTWRVAASKLLTDLSATEEADVRTIDVDIAARKVANRNPNDLSPESLNTYQRRVGTAIKEFVAWRENPTSYKPRGANGKDQTKSSRRSKSENESRSTNEDEGQTQKKVTTSLNTLTEKEIPVTSGGLPLSFPLRPDFLAQVVIPRDLTSAEAKRLGAFLLTIAVDFNPTPM